MPEHTFLIVTVGGTAEPIVASIKHWRPEKIKFIVSPETESQIQGKIIPFLLREDYELSPGVWEACLVPSAQDLGKCVEKMRELSSDVEKWLARGEGYRVVVDFTGGTKCMTAALSLQAHRWRCAFSYVGGTARTRDGIGIVVNGKEQVLHTQNPWNTLGRQALEDAVSFFDGGFYAAAVSCLDQWLPRVTDSTVKRELATCRSLAEAYYDWDNFKHKDAINHLEEVKKNANDLMAFGSARATKLRDEAISHIDYLRQMLDAGAYPTIQIVKDLLANAKRRGDQHQYVDAVARSYRAVEALAQVQLAQKYEVRDTGKVPLASLPPKLKSELKAKAHNGKVKLGLQECYSFLKEKSDELGKRFFELSLHDSEKSPLSARNRSISGHGFEPVTKKTCEKLLRAALALASILGIDEKDLPVFPKFRE